MAPGRYTELFFFDEATALAAGHRPCFECRRVDAVAFAEAWGRAFGLERPPRAGDMDVILQGERVDTGGAKRTHPMWLEALPDAAFYRERVTAEPRMVRGNLTLAWTAEGYGDPRSRNHGLVEVLTPPCIIATLNAGYRPFVHETAGETV